MGAWIEIRENISNLINKTVAPLVGAWIEMVIMYAKSISVTVAPLVGAWIEIDEVSKLRDVLQSLPLWERGLKLPQNTSTTQ